MILANADSICINVRTCNAQIAASACEGLLWQFFSRKFTPHTEIAPTYREHSQHQLRFPTRRTLLTDHVASVAWFKMVKYSYIDCSVVAEVTFNWPKMVKKTKTTTRSVSKLLGGDVPLCSECFRWGLERCHSSILRPITAVYKRTHSTTKKNDKCI